MKKLIKSQQSGSPQPDDARLEDDEHPDDSDDMIAVVVYTDDEGCERTLEVKLSCPDVKEWMENNKNEFGNKIIREKRFSFGNVLKCCRDSTCGVINGAINGLNTGAACGASVATSTVFRLISTSFGTALGTITFAGMGALSGPDCVSEIGQDYGRNFGVSAVCHA